MTAIVEQRTEIKRAADFGKVAVLYGGFSAGPVFKDTSRSAEKPP